MKRKQTFSREEAGKIRELLKLLETPKRSELKGVRQKLRSMGFYISDYHSGFTAYDFDIEIKKGNIRIIGDYEIKEINSITYSAKPTVHGRKLSFFEDCSFCRIDEINPNSLNFCGFYCIRLQG